MAGPERPFTTVPVRPPTLERLRAYKWGGASFDDVVCALMDQAPVEDFIADRMRQRRGARVDWDALRDALDDRRSG